MLGLEEKDRHLGSRHGIAGAVVAGAAAVGDGLAVELLDPVDGKGGRGRAFDVREDARAGGRRVGGAVLGLQQEDGHLCAGDRVVAAVVAGSASGRDAVAVHLLDVGVEDVGLRHVEEVGEEASGQNARDGRVAGRGADRVRHRDIDEPAWRKERRHRGDLRRADDGHPRRKVAADPDPCARREAGSRYRDGGTALGRTGCRRDARHGRRHAVDQGENHAASPGPTGRGRPKQIARCVCDDPGHRGPFGGLVEVQESRRRVVVRGGELEDGPVVRGGENAEVAESRSVEVTRRIRDERAEEGKAEDLECRERVTVGGIELVDGTVRSAVDLVIVAVGRSIEIAGGVGDDRGEWICSVEPAAETVECRERVTVGGVELEDRALVVGAVADGCSIL